LDLRFEISDLQFTIAQQRSEPPLPKYLIERELPGAGNLSQQQLQAVSQKSCSVLRSLGPQIEWVHSYVTGDKIYCIYNAPSEELIRQHAKQGGFPANRISEIKTMIDPSTAETDERSAAEAG
jgi:Protein of unknown function (DUF4242)